MDGFFLDLDLLVFVWIWTVSLDLDLVGFFSRFGFERFSVGSGLLVFFGSGSFLVFGWIGLDWFFFGNGSFGFQSGLDLKRYFQKALKVNTKEVDRYWIFNCLVFLRIGFCQFLDGSS